MQKSLLNRFESSSFSKFSNEFLYHSEQFSSLIEVPFSVEAIARQMNLKSGFSKEKRVVLVNVLNENYSSIKTSTSTKENIDLLLKENTFTVTTGHQLNLFTGPIYFIYKILHTIKLAEILKQKYPSTNFVPIYWMASEDHDFEEINHTFLYNQKIEWKSEQRGPVGQYKLENWSEIQETVATFFKNHPESKIHEIIQSYSGKNLAEATFSLVNELFKDYALVILDANNKKLKAEFSNIMLQEVKESFAEKCVLKTNEKLEKLGYKAQILARPINLFYIGEDFRERILIEDDMYHSEHLGKVSLAELERKISENSEQFSPNVVLRPVYQETILPNLVYIGGGAEIHYWTQLKAVFDAVNVPFPLLQVRNSVQLFDKNAQKKLTKLGLSSKEIFTEINELKKNFVAKNSDTNLDFTDLEEKSNVLQSALNQAVISYDANLKGFAEAENIKITKQIEGIKQKIQKMHKAKFEQELTMLEDLKNKLFPNGVLQERNDNFFNFCPDGNYSALIQELYELIDPLEKDLILGEI